MGFSLGILFRALLIFNFSFSEVRVIFFEGLSEAGSPIVLEPGGRFFHVAIQVDSLWLTAHPKLGTVLTDRIAGVGIPTLALESYGFARPGLRDIEKYVGKPFDFKFTWRDPNCTYCSRLIENVLVDLGVFPQSIARPMLYNSPFWDGKEVNRGEPGVSPDGLYRALREQGFQERLIPFFPSAEGVIPNFLPLERSQKAPLNCRSFI